MNTATQITNPASLPGTLPAFPDAPVPRNTSDARAMLETTRGLLAEALRQVDDLTERLQDRALKVSELASDVVRFKTAHEQLVKTVEFFASDNAFVLGALAKKHAAVTIREWTFDGKHVPARWTAAHPPDDPTATALAEALGDEGFTAYSETFRAAWAERMEQIADEREVKHGSGKVKV